MLLIAGLCPAQRDGIAKNDGRDASAPFSPVRLSGKPSKNVSSSKREGDIIHHQTVLRNFGFMKVPASWLNEVVEGADG